jgi:GT2 family glycosyltransferase
MTTVDLIIPSYARPNDLARALAAVAQQKQAFHSIVVVARSEDSSTIEVARDAGAIIVTVDEPGVLAAMAEGVRHSRADIVAFSDDDAEVNPRHVSELIRHFESSDDIAGVGGRDVLIDNGRERPTTLTTDVGRLTWWGRVIGNHHRGTGPLRDVIALKGVNAAYRRELLALPQDLRGTGAQAHFEIAVGTRLRAHGYRLVYDAALQVRHHPAPRQGDDQRSRPHQRAVFDSAFNLERSIPQSHSTRRAIYVVLVGDANTPGLLRALLALLRGERGIVSRLVPSWGGTVAAWRLRRKKLLFLDHNGQERRL